MAQLNELLVTGASRFLNTIEGTSDRAYCSEYMKKGVDYVTAGQKSGTILGTGATAEGYLTTASGNYSHAEGRETIASSTGAHAEGYSTTASGTYSHAEGYNTKATKSYSHSEGFSTTASGDMSHAEGYYTVASGYYSHSEGQGCTASKICSHAEGGFTYVASEYQFVCGKYNKYDNAASREAIFLIGNGTGTDTSSRHNAFMVTTEGTMRNDYTGGGYAPVVRAATSNTIPNLINEVKLLGVTMGSVNITTVYSLNRQIPTGWYTYLYIPLDTNPSRYGALWLLGMTNTNYTYYVTYYNASISRVRQA